MTIEIENLTFKTIIGILDFERVTPQRVIVNLKATYTYKSGNFIDYVDLTKIIKDSMNQNQFELIEDALDFLIQKITSKYPNITKIYLKIGKPDILNDCQVSLSKTFYKR